MITLIINALASIDQKQYAKYDFVIKDGKILKILPHGSLLPDADKVIDASGQLLAPGFSNAHTHLPMSMFRGAGEDLSLENWLNDTMYPLEDRLYSEAVYLSSLISIIEMVKSGTTSIIDMYYFCADIFRAVKESGIRAILSRSVVGDKEQAAVRIRESEELREMCLGEPLISFGNSLHAEYSCPFETIEQVTGIAAENGEPLIIHLSETKNENDGCRSRYNGLSPTQVFMKAGADKTKLIAAHGVWLDDTDMELLRGKTVVTCPQSNLKLGSGIADVPRMLEHGINVALGTDGAASNNNLDMLLETRFLTLLSKRTDPLRMKGATALKIARAGGTKAMGVNAGRLEEGAEADLILIDISSERYQPLLNLDSHIVYSSRSDDVTMTMVAGNILMSERRILFADEKEIRARFDECARNIYQGE